MGGCDRYRVAEPEPVKFTRSDERIESVDLVHHYYNVSSERTDLGRDELVLRRQTISCVEQ